MLLFLVLIDILRTTKAQQCPNNFCELNPLACQQTSISPLGGTSFQYSIGWDGAVFTGYDVKIIATSSSNFYVLSIIFFSSLSLSSKQCTASLSR